MQTTAILAAERGVYYWIETGWVIFVIGAVILGFLTVGYRLMTGKPLDGGPATSSRQRPDKPPTRQDPEPRSARPESSPRHPESAHANVARPRRRPAPRHKQGQASQSLSDSRARTSRGMIALVDTIDREPDQQWPVKLLIKPDEFLQLASEPAFHGWMHLTYWEAPSADPSLRLRPNKADDIVYLWHEGRLIGQLEGDDVYCSVGLEILRFEEEDQAAVYAHLTWHHDSENGAVSRLRLGWDRVDEDNISASLYGPDEQPDWNYSSE